MTLWSSANYHPPTQQERAALNGYFGGITQDLGTDWVREKLGPEIADELERTGAILAILSGNAETLLEAEKMLQEGATPAEVRAFLRGQAVVNGVVNAATMGFGHALGVAIEKFLKIPAVQQAIKGASKAAGQKITKGLDALEGLVKSGGGAASAEEQAAIREGLDELGKLARKNPELQSTLDELAGAAKSVVPKNQFKVGRHGDMPSPRGGAESHHGVMSRWMEDNFKNYKPENAPAILMDGDNHNATRRAFNAWRSERGGKVDWSNVSEAEIRDLSERLFNAAGVPAGVRSEYYQQFEAFLKTLQKR